MQHQLATGEALSELWKLQSQEAEEREMVGRVSPGPFLQVDVQLRGSSLQLSDRLINCPLLFPGMAFAIDPKEKHDIFDLVTIRGLLIEEESERWTDYLLPINETILASPTLSLERVIVYCNP